MEELKQLQLINRDMLDSMKTLLRHRLKAAILAGHDLSQEVVVRDNQTSIFLTVNSLQTELVLVITNDNGIAHSFGLDQFLDLLGADDLVKIYEFLA